MTKRANFPNRVQQRREDAQARTEARAKRTPAEQRRILENRGHGHCREHIRLGNQIAQ